MTDGMKTEDTLMSNYCILGEVLSTCKHHLLKTWQNPKESIIITILQVKRQEDWRV